MSKAYYSNQWRVAQSDLNTIFALERPPKALPMITTWEGAIKKVFIRYAQYIDVFKRLQDCYDNMVHPQKRNLLGKCIEGVVGRIVELRYELLRVRGYEYAPFGHLCLQFDFVPEDLEMELSHTFQFSKAERLREREQALLHILQSLNQTGEERGSVRSSSSQTTVPGPPPPTLTPKWPQPALTPTARRSTLQGASVSSGRSKSTSSTATLEISSTKSKEIALVAKKSVGLAPFRIREIERIAKPSSLTKFQALWKGYRARKEVDAHIAEMETFLGMRAEAPNKLLELKDSAAMSKAIKAAKQNEEIYEREILHQTQAMKNSDYGASRAHDMMLTIRQWILDCKEATGKFPDFPPEEDGGSIVLFVDKTPEQVKEELDEEDENQGKKKPPAKAAKKKEAAKKSKQKKEGPENYRMPLSKFVDEVLIETAREFEDIWRNRDERTNRHQRFDRVLLKEQVKESVDALLRRQVDVVMRQELVRVSMAIDKQAMKEMKPAKKKKEKKPKGKKKGKDLTQGIPMDDLFKEMVVNGIIKRVQTVPLKSFLGEYNIVSDEESPSGVSRPDLADIRKMIFDFAILPMSSSKTHENVQFEKAIMIAGPRGSGKRMLVHSVCYELGATLIDLSPANLAGKYPGKDGQKMLAHLVMKVGKALEPTVIFLDNCDLVFTKKPPPDAPPNPGRMKADLMKFKKLITPEDRILILGTSSKPYGAAQGPLLKLFDRIIPIWPPTYGSLYKLWQTMIEARGVEVASRYLKISNLAQLTRSFTAKTISNICSEVVTETRVSGQERYPLKTVEFVDRLGLYNPIYQEAQESMLTWYQGTPLYKRYLTLKEKDEAGEDVIGKLNEEVPEEY